MYTHTYVYVYIYIYIYTYVYIHINKYKCVSSIAFICSLTYTCIHTLVICLHTNTNMMRGGKIEYALKKKEIVSYTIKSFLKNN